MQLRRPGQRTPILGHTLDFKSTGMFVHAESGCEVGSAVICTVVVPDGRRRVHGRVVRVEPLASAGVGLGIEFDSTPLQPTPPPEAQTPAPVTVRPTPPVALPQKPRRNKKRGRAAAFIQSAAVLAAGALASAWLVTWILAPSTPVRHVVAAVSPPPRAPARTPVPAAERAIADVPPPPTVVSNAAPGEQRKEAPEASRSTGARTRSRLALKVLPPGTNGPTITKQGRLAGASVPITGSKAEMSHYSLTHPAGIAVNFPHATSPLPLGIHRVYRNGFRTVSILERQDGGVQIRFSFMRGPPEVQTLEVDDAAVILKAVFPEPAPSSL